MKNELEKCLAGEWYDCHDSIFLEYKQNARMLLKEYNALAYEQKERKTEILKEMFGSTGENVSVGLPFICDYGCNIYLGNNVSVNMNCTFVDCNKITIGNNVLVASNVRGRMLDWRRRYYPARCHNWERNGYRRGKRGNERYS